jgi:hypothetical protein
MNLRKLTRGLSYVGEAEGLRRTYHVFRGERHYVVMSLSPTRRGSGNFTIVPAEAVAFVARRFARRKRVTSTDVVRAPRRPKFLSGPLPALNVLYVLVAEGRARVDKRSQERRLYFSLTG